MGLRIRLSRFAMSIPLGVVRHGAAECRVPCLLNHGERGNQLLPAGEMEGVGLRGIASGPLLPSADLITIGGCGRDLVAQVAHRADRQGTFGRRCDSLSA